VKFLPGFAIFLTVSSLNLIGDGLSDALDRDSDVIPSLRGSSWSARDSSLRSE
jgi:hypothetical protein